MSTAYEAGPLKKRRRRTKAEIEEIDTAIISALKVDQPMTVRQVFYRLVSSGRIDKTENQYDAIGRRLKILRLYALAILQIVEDSERQILATLAREAAGGVS